MPDQGHRLVVPAEGADPMAGGDGRNCIYGSKQKYHPLNSGWCLLFPFITSSDHPALRELAEIAAASAGLEKYPTCFQRV